MSRAPIRVVIADDHLLMREGLKAMLADAKGIALVGEAKNGAEAVRLAGTLRPGVVLMDITMPVLDGIEATRQIAATAPATRVVGLTMHTDAVLIGEMLRVGATAVIPKDSGLKAVVKAICAALKAPATRAPRTPRLTPRERDILRLLALGRATKEIAWELSISPKTVETHRAHIIAKLGISSVAGLTKYAYDRGIVPA